MNITNTLLRLTVADRAALFLITFCHGADLLSLISRPWSAISYAFNILFEPCSRHYTFMGFSISHFSSRFLPRSMECSLTTRDYYFPYFTACYFDVLIYIVVDLFILFSSFFTHLLFTLHTFHLFYILRWCNFTLRAYAVSPEADNIRGRHRARQLSLILECAMLHPRYFRHWLAFRFSIHFIIEFISQYFRIISTSRSHTLLILHLLQRASDIMQPPAFGLWFDAAPFITFLYSFRLLIFGNDALPQELYNALSVSAYLIIIMIHFYISYLGVDFDFAHYISIITSASYYTALPSR